MKAIKNDLLSYDKSSVPISNLLKTIDKAKK